jgi:hypothetical protein
MTHINIRDNINTISTNLKSQLLDSELLTYDQAGGVVKRYTAAFVGNFITWLGAGVVASRSAEARYAMAENLEVEIRDNHQGMLWDFSASVNALPNSDDYIIIQPEIESIRQSAANLNGVQLNALAAILETSSLVFIPYLQAMALKLSSRGANMRYIHMHGEADVAHANQFVRALEVEMTREYAHPEQDLKKMMDLTTALLRKIFIPAVTSF